MSKIAVLGAGLVGRTIAVDLSRGGHNVVSYDMDENNLNLLSNYTDIEKKQVDLTMFNYETQLIDFDLIVSAVPGRVGYRVLKDIICGAKKDCVDISFFIEDYRPLDALAKENNLRVVIDCGIAPGMSNMILGREYENMLVRNYKFSVGGLPQERVLPFEYKAPYSPSDVIEFYTRPVRKRINGVDVIEEPLSDIENLYVENIGTLEAFETDGLRTLLTSFPEIQNMTEKTIRYPGYADKINLLKDMGFFKKENLNNTAQVLINEWKMKPSDKDLTVMIADVNGIDLLGNKIHIQYSLVDKHDGEFSSMSRCTAFTCTAVVDLILNKNINEFGVHPPEIIAKDNNCFDEILNHLKNRNVLWQKKYI